MDEKSLNVFLDECGRIRRETDELTFLIMCLEDVGLNKLAQKIATSVRIIADAEIAIHKEIGVVISQDLKKSGGLNNLLW